MKILGLATLCAVALAAWSGDGPVQLDEQEAVAVWGSGFCGSLKDGTTNGCAEFGCTAVKNLVEDSDGEGTQKTAQATCTYEVGTLTFTCGAVTVGVSCSPPE